MAAVEKVLLTSVRENVCSNSKNVKIHVFKNLNTVTN